MGTRSRIGIRQEDGTILSIYCHWDGYYSSVGLTLYQEYKDAEKVRALMSFGDRSSLLDTPSEEGSYGERGEDVPAVVSPDPYAFRALSADCGGEYTYLFDRVLNDDGSWGEDFIWRTQTDLDFIDLSVALRRDGCLAEVPLATVTSEPPPPVAWCPEED